MDRRVAAWAASGAMALTGRADGPPLGPPAGLVDLVEAASRALTARTAGRLAIDGLALLGERAAIEGLARHGATSCGGSSQLLPAADGWFALTLARPDDIALLPAWLEVAAVDAGWEAVAALLADRPVDDLDARAALLGLPGATVGSVAPPAAPAFGLPVSADHHGQADRRGIEGALVVDLSALWAGPLGSSLLFHGGATVVKVESTARPDGARLGPAPLYDLLNAGKRSVALDLGTADGRADLARLVGAADVVVEATRPRALEQLGIVAADVLARDDGPQVWVSITSHGRGPGARDRVAFGDVAAAAGGLVLDDESGPVFCADAIADPLSGLVAAAATLEALHHGGRWLLDVAMAPLAASAAGPQLVAPGVRAEPPRARSVSGPAAALGADNALVLGSLDG